MSVKCKFTVYFEESFWVGVYERIFDKKLEAFRVVFGSEPKDYDIYSFILSSLTKIRLSPPVTDFKVLEKKRTPKRMQRTVNSQMAQKGIVTKAQQALKLQQEQNAIARKSYNKKKNEEEKEKKYLLKQQKKKQKQSGH